MKRWWLYPSERTQTRFRRRGVRPLLVRAAIAGALSLPNPSQAVDIVIIPRTSGVVLPRTGGAVIEAWAIGTLSEARRPNSNEECDLNQVCELAISSPGGAGTGTGVTVQTFFQSAAQGTLPSNLPFALSETIEYGHPTGPSATSGQGACHPATGVMAVADATSTLVLDIVGQACQMGSSNAQLVFTGSYATDSASSGTFANADGIGTISINTPSGLHGTGTTMKASLEGQLKYGD
jgi:hypothetical protein